MQIPEAKKTPLNVINLKSLKVWCWITENPALRRLRQEDLEF
jgi:hypothetical protein